MTYTAEGWLATLIDPSGVLWHVALNEDRGDVGVKPCSKQQHRRLEGLLAKYARITAHGKGMQINYAMEALWRLIRHPTHYGAHEIPEMLLSSGLYAGQDAGHE